MNNTEELLSVTREAISRSNARWTATDKSLVGLTDTEKRRRLGYTPGPNEPSLSKRESVSLETSIKSGGALSSASYSQRKWDWRNVGGQKYIKKEDVRDQGDCGSCVAFGTIAALEASFKIREKNPDLSIDLSEAYLFYCIARSQGRNCGNGWWIEPAIDACRRTGVPEESCFPYRPGDQDCHLSSDWESRIPTRVVEYKELTNVWEMREWISNNGPLITAFTVYEDFYGYGGGIYKHVTGTAMGGHCVCVVGYDDDIGCWICKNSWGQNFGEDGFFRIEYGQCGIDATMWAIVAAPRSNGALYSYWNSGIQDHMCSSMYLGRNFYGWSCEGVIGYVEFEKKDRMLPLYFYWNPGAGDHMLTTRFLGGYFNGWYYERVLGFVYDSPRADASPLYFYWNSGARDHLCTSTYLGPNYYGWVCEGIIGYISNRPKSSSLSTPTLFSDASGSSVPLGGEPSISTNLKLESTSSMFTLHDASLAQGSMGISGQPLLNDGFGLDSPTTSGFLFNGAFPLTESEVTILGNELRSSPSNSESEMVQSSTSCNHCSD